MKSDRETQDKQKLTPSNLYKIITPGNKISYLFGTLHIAQEFPSILKLILDRVSTLIIEKNPRLDYASSDSIEKWIAQNPTSSNFFDKANFTDDQITKIKEIFSSIADDPDCSDAKLERVINQMTPMQLIFLLNTYKMADPVKTGMDMLLVEYAKKTYTPIDGLESADEVQDIITGVYLTFDEQINYFHLNISDTLNSDESKMNKILDKLRAAYDSANLSVISACIKGVYIDKKARDNIPDIAKKIYHHCVTSRDDRFYENLKKHLSFGDNLIAVGNAHLLGLLKHLKKAGCEISMIPYDGNLDHEYPSISTEQLDYISRLSDYLYRSDWYEREEATPKVKSHLQHSIFNSDDASKIAEYIKQGKHSMPKDENEGNELLDLTKKWGSK